MLYSKLVLNRGNIPIIRSSIRTFMRWILISVFTALITGSCTSEQEVRDSLTIIDEAGESVTEFNVSEENQSTESIAKEGDIASEEVEKEEKAGTISVYICGAILYAGVYEMEEGSRIVDVIECAGGLREDAADTYLNQAEFLEDGQKLYVPTKQEVEEGIITNSVTSSGEAQADSKVNINSASKEELMTLTGIGESKAESIIEYRESQGEFSSPEDIQNITGIKEGVYNNIKDEITT
ncbi:MAG: ComEA family DNA-binding protein [Eubacteriales bacterium]